MATIRELFDKSKPIDRRIEKVITYETTDEELLKHEVQEYVATASIENHFERLLDQMEEGMSRLGSHCGRIEIIIHPTQKPVALYRWLLHNYANPGDLILDTHVGSASSLIACEQMGFQYIGIEKDKDYYDAACERMAKAREKLKQQEIYNRLHEGMDIYLMRDVFSEACRKAIERN